MPHPSGGYRNKNGEKIPGVTTIIGNRVSPGGLMYWANRLAYEPLMRYRHYLYQYAYGTLLTTDIEPIKELLSVNPDSFDHNKAAGGAADAGTACHAMVELYLNGKEPETALEGLPDDISGLAQTAFLGFLEWAQSTRLEVAHQELGLVSERHQFGGTLDACVLKINGKMAIGDWKTSNGLYPDHLIQVAAYRELYAENFPEEKLDGGMYIFRFSKDYGDFHAHYFTELNDGWQAFLHLRALYDLDKSIKKRAK